MTSVQDPRKAQGGGYPPGGYGGPPPPPGGYGPPGAPGGYGPPGAPGGYGPPGYVPHAAPYGYGAPPPGAGGPLGPPNSPLKKQAQTWLIISAASFFFCTSCFGVIGAVLCYMAMQAVDQGNLADAENKLKWGKIITIAGFALGLLLTILGVAMYAAQLAALFHSP